MIRVVNRRTHTSTPYDIYIGRGSVLGNPFTHKQGTKAQWIVGTREEAIARYIDWITSLIHERNAAVMGQINLIANRVRKGYDVNLVCYCKPLACHGDVIKKIAEDLLNQEG